MKTSADTHIPLPCWTRYTDAQSLERVRALEADLKRRRSVRAFSEAPVARQLIEHCILIAGSAPSGANHQPWHFACVSEPATKRAIREAAEAAEQAFYAGRAGKDWLEALAPIGTDWQKPYLEIAPWLICIFAQRRGGATPGEDKKNYYIHESVGIATGLLIAACHTAGLATLVHTPSPMGFLSEVCGRPATEKPYLILVVGHPAENAQVPRHALKRKSLDEIASFL